MITLGEGWHNNHHFYAGSTRQGFYWWQIDVTYYLLKVMSWFGLVWGLKPIPARVYAASHRNASSLYIHPKKLKKEDFS
jgi:stearoyl-CoA desaturase (delta-9 desaturase)